MRRAAWQRTPRRLASAAAGTRPERASGLGRAVPEAVAVHTIAALYRHDPLRRHLSTATRRSFRCPPLTPLPDAVGQGTRPASRRAHEEAGEIVSATRAAQMRVLKRRGQIRVPERLLDQLERGPVLPEARREAVAEHVGVAGPADERRDDGAHDGPDRAPAERLARAPLSPVPRVPGVDKHPGRGRSPSTSTAPTRPCIRRRPGGIPSPGPSTRAAPRSR
jgi:hypothetical protein